MNGINVLSLLFAPVLAPVGALVYVLRRARAAILTAYACTLRRPMWMLADVLRPGYVMGWTWACRLDFELGGVDTSDTAHNEEIARKCAWPFDEAI
ncbi:MAG TPA: hypothetical protein VHB46_04485 [Burkholderiales bacterium]|nr:hypothetical protein [Burkholderiales bacterium]